MWPVVDQRTARAVISSPLRGDRLAARPQATMKTSSIRLLRLLAALLTGAVAFNAAGSVQQIDSEPADAVGNSIHGFDLYNSGLFWASGGNTCGGEFATFTRIGLLGYAGFPPLAPHYVMVDCMAVPAGCGAGRRVCLLHRQPHRSAVLKGHQRATKRSLN